MPFRKWCAASLLSVGDQASVDQKLGARHVPGVVAAQEGDGAGDVGRLADPLQRNPAEVIRELRGRLSGQFLWGSDYPFFTPERCLSELEALDLPAEVMSAVLHDNAARILS